MDTPECRAEMLRIGTLAKTKDVYLVCFERPDLVKAGYDNIAKALRVEA
jgi:hypothetical protein